MARSEPDTARRRAALAGAFGASALLIAAPAAGSTKLIELFAPKNARVIRRRLTVTGIVQCPTGQYGRCTAMAKLYVEGSTAGAKGNVKFPVLNL